MNQTWTKTWAKRLAVARPWTAVCSVTAAVQRLLDLRHPQQAVQRLLDLRHPQQPLDRHNVQQENGRLWNVFCVQRSESY